MKSSDLTNGERLQLVRRREGLNQTDAAASHEVTPYRYRRWERDLDRPPSVPTGRIALHEACFVKRTRAGVGVQELADLLGVSKFWVIKMESGREDCDRLAKHWGIDKNATPWRSPANVG